MRERARQLLFAPLLDLRFFEKIEPANLDGQIYVVGTFERQKLWSNWLQACVRGFINVNV